MRQADLRYGMAITTVLLASACGGGGGGGGAQPVELATKADILREVANLDPAAIGATVAEAQATSARKSRSAPGRTSPWTLGSRSFKEAQTFQCDVGTYTTNPQTGSRDMSLFRFSGTMDYVVDRFQNCRENQSQGNFDSWHGYVEYGNNWQFADGTPLDPYYDYRVTGRDGEPLRTEEVDGIRRVMIERGREEVRDAGDIETWRLNREFDVSVMDQDFNGYSVTVAYGRAGDPAEVTWDHAAGTVALDGRMQYTSSLCSGGAVDFETSDPLSVGYDNEGYFVTGGQLRIRAGSRAVMLTFGQDGSATYQFGNGDTGVISRAEFDAAPSCIEEP